MKHPLGVPDQQAIPAQPPPVADPAAEREPVPRAQGRPFRATAPYDWGAVLSLIQREFAFMEGRIDPPSAVDALTPEDVETHARGAEVWVIEDGARPVATAFFTPQPPTLYVGRLAVAASHCNAGHARALVAAAEARARALGLDTLTAQSRIELTEVHVVLNALGFSVVGTTAHPGYARPTSITMQRPVTPE